jgi:putative Mg2+ transporter-C (MgtC) family protein
MSPVIGQVEIIMTIHVLGAMIVGGLIGLERSYHGRPAGFRTHALVCMASSLLMLVTVYQGQWMTLIPADAVRTDPTRMAQGIMTGIGFLGAGVIIKEGLTVRGLTTAASIWITSAIGILVGIGFYFPAILGTIGTLVVLSLFRYIERKLPSEHYAHHMLRFHRLQALDEPAVRALMKTHGFSIANLSQRLTSDGDCFEYRMVLRSRDRKSADSLSRKLREMPEVVEFRITPTGD